MLRYTHSKNSIHKPMPGMFLLKYTEVPVTRVLHLNNQISIINNTIINIINDTNNNKNSNNDTQKSE